MEFFFFQPIVEDTGNLFKKEKKKMLSIKNSPSVMTNLVSTRVHGFESSFRNLLAELFP